MTGDSSSRGGENSAYKMHFRSDVNGYDGSLWSPLKASISKYFEYLQSGTVSG